MGLTVTEVVVAAALIVSMIGLFAPMTVRIGRVWQSTRQYRLAFNELANQMERLTCLGPSECEAALPDLAISVQLAEALPNSKLHGEVINDQDGLRLKLTLDWERGAESNRFRWSAGSIRTLQSEPTKWKGNCHDRTQRLDAN